MELSKIELRFVGLKGKTEFYIKFCYDFYISILGCFSVPSFSEEWLTALPI